MRHVIVMTAATSVGLMAIFIVDLLSLLYVSWLGDPKLTAAVGFASQVLFFSISINIGLSIATGALVSRAHGKGDRDGARRLAASGLVHVFLIAALASAAAWAAAAGDFDPPRRPRHDSRCRLDLSRDHASGHRFARPRHGACEHIARRGRRKALDVCDSRGSHRHGSSRPGLYFWSRPWRHGRGHCHVDFTIS